MCVLFYVDTRQELCSIDIIIDYEKMNEISLYALENTFLK